MNHGKPHLLSALNGCIVSTHQSIPRINQVLGQVSAILQSAAQVLEALDVGHVLGLLQGGGVNGVGAGIEAGHGLYFRDFGIAGSGASTRRSLNGILKCHSSSRKSGTCHSKLPLF